MKKFLPDLFLKDIYDIDVEYIKRMGIKGLILDVDNTLVAQYIPAPDERLINWIKYLKDNSIKLCIVSNGSPKRVEKFNKDINIYAVTRAMKPFKKGFLQAMKVMDILPEEVAVVGDQLFTDVWGGKRLKMFTILVDKIDENEVLCVRLKRYLENIILKKYSKDLKEKRK